MIYGTKFRTPSKHTKKVVLHQFNLNFFFFLQNFNYYKRFLVCFCEGKFCILDKLNLQLFTFTNNHNLM